MAIERRMVHFRAADLAEVLTEIDAIAERANGREWVTLSPWVDPENLPVVSMLQRIFSARGSKIPEVTWVPAHDDEPAQLGVLHATGAGALDRLADDDIASPPGWVTLGDHSKRGLLLAIHPNTDHRMMLEYAIAAAGALAMVPTDDRWVAQISTSSR